MTRRVMALVVLGVLAVAGCSSSSEPSPSLGPSVSFTGTECVYDGPSEFDLNSTVTFTFTNDSDKGDVGFGVMKFPEGVTAEEISAKGMNKAVADAHSASMGVKLPPTVKGTEYQLTATFIETGQHGINCFSLGGNAIGADHVTMFTVTE